MKPFHFLTGIFALSLSTQALTLDEALCLAAEKSPGLRAARLEAQAASADAHAVSMWANPELGFEAEKLGGDYHGADAAEYTLSLSQEFPTSGKLRKARAAGVHGAEAAQLAILQKGRDFEIAVRQAFIEAQAAQEILAVREQQLVLAAEFLKAAQKRYEAGAASELEVLRAEMMLESGQGDQLAAEKNQEAARQKLARLIGLPNLGKLEGDFFQTLEIPSGLALQKTLPTLQRFQALENQADAKVALAKSARIPDVTFGAGARYEESGNVQSYLFSASIPLPLFNRGGADVLSAGLRAEAIRFEHQLALREMEDDLSQARTEFEIASAEVHRFQTVLLPKAERVVELMQAGYASGRYGWLEQVETQQMLADARIGMIEARRTALRAQTQLLKFYTENGL